MRLSCAYGWLAHSRARLQICSSNLLDQLLDYGGIGFWSACGKQA
jgi:hypothetical protein